MAGAQVRFWAFDATKKSSWFFADLNGAVYVWIASTLAYALIICGFEKMGISLFQVFQPLGHWLSMLIGEQGVFLILFGLSYVPAFIIVFVLRYNFNVSGPRRQFRYFCRWL